jgi:hypothetical protein
MHPPACSCPHLLLPTQFLFFPCERWWEWKGQSESMSLFL